MPRLRTLLSVPPVLAALVAAAVLTPGAPAAAAPPSGAPRDAQPARVERVVDGDTVHLRGSGRGPLAAGAVTKVRLLVVDTPEQGACWAAQATAWLARTTPRGATVWVQRDRELRDRYGRTLLYVWTARGAFVNRATALAGNARAVYYAPNGRYLPTVRQAEAQARQARRGLWGGCAAPSPTPRPSSRSGCEPAYPDVCIPPAPPDLDCGEITHRRFRVLAPDPHGFDGNGDGVGCESG